MKSTLIKLSAIAMLAAYLLLPLASSLSGLMHHASHALGNVVSTVLENETHSHHHHGIADLSPDKHHSHSHPIIQFLKDVGSDTEVPAEQQTTNKINFDKHFSASEIEIPNLAKDDNSSYGSFQENLATVFLNTPTPPPRV